jgi:hypothetical protein
MIDNHPMSIRRDIRFTLLFIHTRWQHLDPTTKIETWVESSV